MTLLSSQEFDRLFQSFESSAFRLETLSVYRVDDEESDLKEFLGGRLLPDLGALQPWLDGISEARAQGKTYERIRLVPDPLTSYFRYELEWGYLYSAQAGEQVRLLQPDAQMYAEALDHGDFWLFDNQTLVRMDYAPDGTYRGAKADGLRPALATWIERLRNETQDLTVYLAKTRQQ